jgi:hypothetical protein
VAHDGSGHGNVVDIIEAACDPLALGRHGGGCGAASSGARSSRSSCPAIAKSTPPENSEQILAACDRTCTPATRTSAPSRPARVRLRSARCGSRRA